jgi:hypothetical protein
MRNCASENLEIPGLLRARNDGFMLGARRRKVVPLGQRKRKWLMDCARD